MQITVDQIKAVLNYDPETGVFTWIKNGRVAGWANPLGYVYIRVLGKLRQAHRLAWLYVHGEFPAENIDHKNRVPGDNRISNLRPCTQRQNLANTATRRDSTTGIKGVNLMPHGRYRAMISRDGRMKHLGMFASAAEAQAAYLNAAREMRGEFACGGA